MQQSPLRRAADAGAWIALAVMIATQLYAIIDRQVFMLVADEMSKTLHLSNAHLGLIQGMGFAVFTVVAAYPIAWLADRFDRRWVLAACVLCWAMGTAACGLAGGYAALFIASAAVAVSEAGIAPIFISMLPELFRGQSRVTANMISYIGGSLSSASGYFMVGAMIAAVDVLKPLPAPLSGLEDWRLAFLAAAAPFPIFIAMIYWLPTGRASAAPARTKPSAAPILPFLKANLKSVALLFIGMTAFALGLTSILAWTPVSLTRIFGVSPAHVGIVMGTVSAIASIAGVTGGTFILRYLQRQLGFRAAPRVVWVSLVALIPLVCLLPFATAPWQVFAFVGVEVFVTTIAGASSLTFLQDLAPPEVRARLVALRAMTNGPAVGLGVSGAAWLADLIKAGRQSLVWGGVCISIPALLICVLCLKLAEKPFETTARESTGLQSPLDLAPQVTNAA